MNGGLFIDRDGCIIEDKGFLSSPDEVVLIDGVIDSLKKVQKLFRIFIVTNQECISRGIVSQEEVDLVNNHLLQLLEEGGVEISGLYVCPHTKADGCSCRKPSPFSIKDAVLKFGIDPVLSFSIGDHMSDVNLCKNYGGEGLYVLTGHGSKHLDSVPEGVKVFKDLNFALEYVAGEVSRNNQ